MHGQELVDAVRDSHATELDRLGSDKYLIAATGADLERAPVLRVMAEHAASGRDTFGEWADAATADAASEAFDAAATAERDAFDRVVESLSALPNDDADAAASIDADADPLDAALADCDVDPERVAAGFVARPLVADRTHLQVVNFFVNEADESRADLARDLRSGAQNRLSDAPALLDAVCEIDDDWERARAAAERVVDAAYDDYAATLDSMGVDPKPVC